MYGPTSPHLDGSFGAVLAALETFMLVPPGGLGVVDVRDLATMLARAVEPGRGPRHYLAGGQYVTWAQWTEALGAAAGVDVAHQEVSAAEMIDLGRHFDRLRSEGRSSAPLSEEAAIIMTSGVPTDDEATLVDLACRYRSLAETFTDTVDYLARHRSTGAMSGTGRCRRGLPGDDETEDQGPSGGRRSHQVGGPDLMCTAVGSVKPRRW